MLRTLPRPGIITPPRGVQRPLWPFAVNRDSLQAQGLLRWYPSSPVGIDTLFDLGDAPGYPGTLTGNTTWTADVEDGGNVLSFDGTNSAISISANNLTFLRSLSNVCVACWALPLQTSPVSGTVYNGAGMVMDNAAYWGLLHTNYTGQDNLWAYVWDGSAKVVGSSYTVGIWTHLVLLLLAGSLSMYMNGALVGSVACGAIQNNSSSQVMGVGYQLTNYFHGYLRDVRVYDANQIDTNVFAEMYDPHTRWELYYPLRQRVWPFTVGRTAAFRKTLSGIGTGTGKRQVHRS